MSDLIMKNINKVYPGDVHAVQDFDMTIKDGEFVVLVGPSGCGKSTMLRMIAGLESITDGELILGDKVLNNIAASDRNIAMVFQNYALFTQLSVYDNMGISLAILHENKDVIHEKVMEATEIVNLKKELNRKPKALSGGQKQRVALGRSIVRNADIFLLDEPLSNLDAKLRAKTRKEIVDLKNKLNRTFIYVTHDQVEAMTMADRIVIMNGGVVQQIANPYEIYNKPANTFVAGFIGTPSMNFMSGVIKDGTFKNDCVTIKLSDEMAAYADKNSEKDVIMGIRPEAFTLAVDDEYDIIVDVDRVEYLGSEYIVSFKFTQRDEVYNAKFDGAKVAEPINDKIKLKVDMKKTHLFDVDSKVRLV